MESTTVAARAPLLSRDAAAFAGLTLASLGWASAFIAGKVVLAEMTPLAASAWRYAIAALALAPFAFRELARLNVKGIVVPLACVVVSGSIVYPWLFLSSLALTTATNSSLLIALNPVFTVLAAPLIGERLTLRRLAGVGLALAGAATVITQGDWQRLLGLSFNRGDLLAVGAALTWACFNVASRPVVSRLSPAAANTLVYGIGFFALLALSAPQHPVQQLVSASAAALAGLFVMAAVASVISGQLFLMGVRTLGVGRTVVFIYLVPVLTAILSALLLDEALTLAQAAGGAAVLAGVYLTSRSR